MPANYIFLPWVQPGTATHIPDKAMDRLKTSQPGFVSFQIGLVINQELPVSKTVRFYGPGDVTGIDPHQVVRTEPRPNTRDFEPNYFPAIEFDRPDLPWLFTPAKSDSNTDAKSRLRPWLCLVVVRKQKGVALRPAVTTPLPVLEIKDPARPSEELPNLSESWAWAHVQVIGSERQPDALTATLVNAPARSVSRLLCPRRLEPNTEYVACVVPTFELGRKSGLGQQIGPADENLNPAWPSLKSSDLIELPVYYHWAFRTGAAADFEELVRRLKAREMPPEVGKRSLDISRPGFRLQPPSDEPGTTLGLEGALRVVKTGPDDWSEAKRLPFQTELKRLINTPWQIATTVSEQRPVVGPPIYGCWQATKHEVAPGKPSSPAPPATWPPPFWLDELNLDPRNRVLAGAGAEVVRKEQESLMASAWDQLGEIEKINQRLRQAQLSRSVNHRYHVKIFSRLSEETLLKILAPAQSRIVVDESPAGQPATARPVLLSQKLAASGVPTNTVSAGLRRLARPRGAINRRFERTVGTRVPGLVKVFKQKSEERPPPKLGETIWVDDEPPAGAVLENWTKFTTFPKPYTGKTCHGFLEPGVVSHSFHSTPTPFDVGIGDRLFAYVLVHLSQSPTRQIMLQWHSTTDGWGHRAYWGENLIPDGIGADGTIARRRLGDLPVTDVWVRLEVPAGSVGLEGHFVDGMAFIHLFGRATWDRAGQYSPHSKGPITIERVSDMLPAGVESVLVPGTPNKFVRVPDDQILARESLRLENLVPQKMPKTAVQPNNAPLLKAARDHQKYLARLFDDSKVILGTIGLGTLAKVVPQSIQKSALVSLNPSKTIAARVLGNLGIKSPSLTTGDPLDPVMDAPAFPQPMYESLRDLSPEFLFPGLDQVPPDSVQLLETNALVIESYMVGLNAEMGRELLWRGYPTDQRGTYFQHFWDAVDDDPDRLPDIPPIHSWGKRKLGNNTTGAAAGNKLVLLIRGELLRRYPNTIIYAVQAVSKSGRPHLPPEPFAEIHPIFRGAIEPDVTFVGFDLTVDDVRKESGYFFVLQQQPSEPRFGLDVAPAPGQPDETKALPLMKNWNQLHWGHPELKALDHVSFTKALTVTNDQGKWFHNSAHMAYITKQRLVRIAIHESQMLPPA